MGQASVLFLAMIADAVLGEPRWLWSHQPHPAILMGRAVAWLDNRLNHGSARRIKGAFAMLVLAGGAVALGLILAQFGPVVEVIIAAILLALEGKRWGTGETLADQRGLLD